LKALGKKPPKDDLRKRPEHFRQALIEASEELDRLLDAQSFDIYGLSKKLRISAGVE